MKRFKINWAMPGLFAMILIIAAVAWMQTQSAASPDPAKLATQCSACHTMDTQVQAWKDSSHKNVACTECHADPGVGGWVQMQVGLIRMQFDTADVDLSKIATEVPNQRCMDCHARQMPWVMQDLKPAKLDEKGEPIRPDKSQLQFLSAAAGHDVHLTMENPLGCTECHSAVSHGPAPAQRVDHVATMHKICLDCHAEQKVAVAVRNTVSCSACHIDLAKVTPEDHKSASFRNSHGDSAVKDAAACTQCHLNPGISGKASEAPHGLIKASLQQGVKPALIPQMPPGTITAPADLKDACASCHGTTMPHPANWMTQHTKGYNDNPALCASCHGTRDQGFNMTFKGNPRTLSTTDPSCTNCHSQPMPHPEDYLNGGHQSAGKAAPQTCEQCHSPNNPANPKGKHATSQFCKDCHLGKYNHPAGYVFKHAGTLAAYGNNTAAAGCTQCHSTVQGGENSCAACHKGSLTNTEWHPAGYGYKHADTMAAYGNNPAVAGCTQCHSTTQSGPNSCATCHGENVTKSEWHPANYVATHKDTLAKVGNNQAVAGCTECHGETKAQNTCTACHSNGLTDGKPTVWHPKNWWIVHAQKTTPADAVSCNQCHSYVQPSCSQCHTKY